MLKVNFGERWTSAQQIGLDRYYTEDEYLVVHLSLSALIAADKRDGIEQARWRLHGSEYQTTRVYALPRNDALVVVAREALSAPEMAIASFSPRAQGGHD